MHRKLLIWTALPVLVLFLYGCPKKKPATPPADLDVETRTVEAPPSAPAQEVAPSPQPSTDDAIEEDPLASGDLQQVNDELRRRGFSANVYFEYDESGLSDDARDRLARNADLLKSQARFSVTIEGHCDSRGTNEYNLALGERRANTVRDYLVSLGVAADRLRAISYGEERPVCTEESESCWSQNRRGHLIITGRSSVG